mmetsp:Transcript_15964/g.23494  ORF Transcript_15964/g.23494 Transcript_15964/m.23494 type:complete len:266 (+) Transcript_15964:75-872(+)
MGGLILTDRQWFVRNDRVIASIGQEDCPSYQASVVDEDGDKPSPHAWQPLSDLELWHPPHLSVTSQQIEEEDTLSLGSSTRVLSAADSRGGGGGCEQGKGREGGRGKGAGGGWTDEQGTQTSIQKTLREIRHLDKAHAQSKLRFFQCHSSAAQAQPIQHFFDTKNDILNNHLGDLSQRYEEMSTRIAKTMQQQRLQIQEQTQSIQKNQMHLPMISLVSPSLRFDQYQSGLERERRASKQVSERGNIERVVDAAAIQQSLQEAYNI